MEDRVSIGVEELDSKMEGGLVKGSVTLVTGKTGTGKTAMCSTFMYKGAMSGDNCVYVTTEERVEDIKGDIKHMFGWDLGGLESDGAIKFISLKPVFPAREDIDMTKLVKIYIFDLFTKIEEAVKEISASRLVIDSVSIIEMFIKDVYLSRVGLTLLIERIKDLGVTSVITGTVPERGQDLSAGGIIEYLVDGVIKLDFVPVAERFKRTLNIRKMRRTDHSIFLHPFDIKQEGIKLVELEKIE